MNFEFTTAYPILPGLMGIWQKQLGKVVEQQNQSQPNPGPRADRTPCRSPTEYHPCFVGNDSRVGAPCSPGGSDVTVTVLVALRRVVASVVAGTGAHLLPIIGTVEVSLWFSQSILPMAKSAEMTV